MSSVHPNSFCSLYKLSAIAWMVWLSGCYAPIHSPGIDAKDLPDEFRWPIRTSQPPLNFSHLVAPTAPEYVLGAGDTLQVTVPELMTRGAIDRFDVRVQDNGEVSLPRLGPVRIGGLTISTAQRYLNQLLAVGLLQNPNATLMLIEKGTVNVLVLGAVSKPGVHSLLRSECDVAHAIAAAEGLGDDAGDAIEIHRRNGMAGQPMHPSSLQFPTHQQVPSTPVNQSSNPRGLPSPVHAASHSVEIPSSVPFGAAAGFDPVTGHPLPGFPNGPAAAILRIPLRGDGSWLHPADVVLNSGDVVVVPKKKDNVFYVVGELSDLNRIRFSVGDRDREIGNGLLLPDDREIDVVTAVVMAGYLDPIESPTTVTVHRVGLDGRPLLIRVDLIAARSDPRESILIQPGDIIYLNPDVWWYWRRTSDRIIDRALGTAIGRWLTQ